MPTLNPEHIKSVIESINKDEKVLAHGTSKLMVTRNMQTIDDVIDYVSADKLPSKFLRRSYVV